MKNDKHKFIFIHIPKTVERVLKKALKKQIKNNRKHLTFFQYENELKSEIEKYFIFL